MKKVAIIMSVYKFDTPYEVERSINSLLIQTHPVDIFIYCDGILPQNLNEILDVFSKEENINLIKNEENKGLSYALNSLIDIVSALEYDYIARMDSDDISLPNRIEKQVNFMENNKETDVLGGACKEFGATFSLEYKSRPLTHDKLKNFSISRCPFIHPTVIFRSSIFIEGFRYPTNTLLTEDMGLWFILLEKGKKFANLPDILLEYKLNEDTINRRCGLSKSLSEVYIRFNHMKKVKAVNIKNVNILLGRFVFHLLPIPIIKLLYKYAR
ncbi:glycosyltransferase [Providencia rettgeri]